MTADVKRAVAAVIDLRAARKRVDEAEKELERAAEFADLCVDALSPDEYDDYLAAFRSATAEAFALRP